MASRLKVLMSSLCQPKSPLQPMLEVDWLSEKKILLVFNSSVGSGVGLKDRKLATGLEVCKLVIKVLGL